MNTSGTEEFLSEWKEKARARNSDTLERGVMGPQNRPPKGEFTSSPSSGCVTSEYMSMYSCTHLRKEEDFIIDSLLPTKAFVFVYERLDLKRQMKICIHQIMQLLQSRSEKETII